MWIKLTETGEKIWFIHVHTPGWREGEEAHGQISGEGPEG